MSIKQQLTGIFSTKTISVLIISFSAVLLACFSIIANASVKEINISQYAARQSWIDDELTEKRKILEAFWQERIIKYNQKSVDDFKNFIVQSHFPQDSIWQAKIERLFQDAISKQVEFDLFFNVLQDIPSRLIKAMNNAEKLIPEDQFAEINNPEITKTDLLNMQQYMKTKRMSASITLGSRNELITPNFPENQSQFTFAMHSVGKVFTGILTLIMIQEGILSEEDLKRPVQLDESVKKQLPPAVREQLTKVTLHQLMTHRSGLGNYLGNYMEAISRGNIPAIKQVEDFLPFIEDKTFPVGEERYSNAGILLVGLAIKHAYEKKFNKPIDYNEMLKQYIINKVGMSSFSPWKPKNGKFNLYDPIAPYLVGSPAGGYWTTAEDLAKFGKWIYQKSSSDPAFKRLIETYGQEFYDADRQIVSHAGGIPSSSAFLSISLKTGAICAVLSDQPAMALDLNTMVQTHIFSRKLFINTANN